MRAEDGTSYFVREKNGKWRLKTPSEYRDLDGKMPKLDQNFLEAATGLDDAVLNSFEIQSGMEYEDRRAFLDLLRKMLEFDPEKRITPTEALEHPFITLSHFRDRTHRYHQNKAGGQTQGPQSKSSSAQVISLHKPSGPTGRTSQLAPAAQASSPSRSSEADCPTHNLMPRPPQDRSEPRQLNSLRNRDSALPLTRRLSGDSDSSTASSKGGGGLYSRRSGEEVILMVNRKEGKHVIERPGATNPTRTQRPSPPRPQPVAANRNYYPESTLCKRMREHDLSVRGTYSDIPDDELDIEVRSVKSRMPDAGYRTVKGALQAMGQS
uniref:Dual-specificity kinase n=1 Tax=Knipowitschia caucasica TaxID=637954 RepID=A0AAV2LJN1_KNICA